MKSSMPVIWAIGGVDPLGVAGIMTDSRAANACNVHCTTIITAVTAQNSHQFYQLNPMKVDSLQAQWHALIEQTQPKVIKIGLLASGEQVTWLVGQLQALKLQLPAMLVVYDPVLLTSSEHQLVDQAMLSLIKRELLPLIDLLTPNVMEASYLAGQPLSTKQDFITLATKLSRDYGIKVLLKGGHLTDQNAADCYVSPEGSSLGREPVASFVMQSPMLDNANIRGTGCAMASLISSHLALGQTVCDALIISKAMINYAIAQSQPLGNSHGGLTAMTSAVSFEYLPTILTLNEYLLAQKSVQGQPFTQYKKPLGLYPVVDGVAWLERLLKLGVKTIQLRAKDLSEHQVEPEIITAIALGQQYQARVYINDYWQLAIKHHAYGVHLGQEDLQLADLSAIKSAGLRLGLSTHGLFEAVVADQLQPSYIALGHIYATTTKTMPSTPQGIENLAQQVKLFKHRRALVAIGGISAARVPSIVATDIGSIALVTAITNASDVEQTVAQLLQQVGDGGTLC